MNEFEIFTKKFTEEKIDYAKEGSKYYFAGDEAAVLSSKIKGTLSAGLPLGETKNGVFKPSVYLLEILSKKTENKVFVNDKAEWLFLCGRDVLPEGVKKNNSTADVFLIQNEKDENLGLGRNMSHSGKKFIKNVLDRGDFLRRERR
jgi:ribosome biogenesis protein Nip4